MKFSIKNQVDHGKRIAANSEQFVQAVALLIVSGFSYWALTQVKVPRLGYYTILAALVVIGLRGLVEFVKFLDKE